MKKQKLAKQILGSEPPDMGDWGNMTGKERYNSELCFNDALDALSNLGNEPEDEPEKENFSFLQKIRQFFKSIDI